MKAFTKVEIKADYIYMQISAYNLVKDWLIELEASGSEIETENLPDPEPSAK